MLFAVSSAMAYKRGDLEFTLGGGGSSDEEFEGTVANIQAGLGCFMTQNLEGTYRQEISFTNKSESESDGDNQSGRDRWNGSTRLSFDYHFDLGAWYPYLGGNIGYVYGDTVKEQFIAGPEAGVKFFVNDTTFINAGIEYQFLFKDSKEANDNFDKGRFIYILGIGFKF